MNDISRGGECPEGRLDDPNIVLIRIRRTPAEKEK